MTGWAKGGPVTPPSFWLWQRKVLFVILPRPRGRLHIQAWSREWQVLQARRSPDTEARACPHANMVVCFQACHLNGHAPEIRSCLLFFIYAPNGLVIVYPSSEDCLVLSGQCGWSSEPPSLTWRFSCKQKLWDPTRCMHRPAVGSPSLRAGPLIYPL